ncbi:MAG: sulfatase [Rikenellaceae bacterium]
MRKNISLALAIVSTTSSFASEQQQPNILLVISDDHSFPHLGAYGDENCLNFNITPNLDAFAKDATLFTKAYTTAPHSAPSRISMWTGMYPLATSTTRFLQPASPDIKMFTDLLRESGYWIGLTGRSHHLSTYGETPAVRKVLAEMGIDAAGFSKRVDLNGRTQTWGDEANNVGNLMRQILDDVPKERPYFLYYGINQPHTPWPKTHEKVDLKSLKLPDDFPDTPQQRKYYARFLQSLSECDTAFGKMIKELKRRGDYDNTLVIFIGDNGESLLRGKGTLYDRGTHVPLIVKLPKSMKAKNAESVVSDLFSGIDIAPTILDVAGIEPAKTMQGISFVDCLQAKEYSKRKFVFMSRGWHPGALIDSNAFNFCRSVTDGRYLLIYNAVPNRLQQVSENLKLSYEQAYKAGKMDKRLYDAIFEYPQTFELYDLEKDPFQLNNLYKDKNSIEIGKILMAQLNGWMYANDDYLALPSKVIEDYTKQGFENLL